MILTNKQEQALKIAVQRYRELEPYTCICGYAGSGKTTIVKFIVEALNFLPGDVCFATYTGKAAQVLRQKGNENAKTLHRLLYKSFQKKDGSFSHVPREELENEYKMIVVDEISMVPRDMWELLLSHGVYVLALGDPGQLEPIAKIGTDIIDHPHVFLDEVLRQAQESNIIRLSMDIREGRPLQLMRTNDLRIVDQTELRNENIYQWADQVLCCKNNTRYSLNNKIRQMRFNTEGSQIPVEGEKIICLKNNWNIVNAPGDALVNGLTGTIENINIKYDNPFLAQYINADFVPDCYQDEDGIFQDLPMDYMLFAEHHQSPNRKNRNKPIPMGFNPEQFDFGYAITAWKAQGSQFGKVLAMEEFMKGETNEGHRRLLYTIVTRAVDKLVLVRA